MYVSEQQRIAELEQLVEKQAFQISLLSRLAVAPSTYGLYAVIIDTNMSVHTFNALRELTTKYEVELQAAHYVSMSDFVHQFCRIVTAEAPHLAADCASFIPKWLGGVNGGFGFSKQLYDHFYATE